MPSSSRAPLALLRPSHQHGFTPREVDEIMDGIHARGDRLMLWFLVSHMGLALVLALYHQTWVATFAVGGLALSAFLLSVHFLPRTFFTRALAGVAQQAFVALHIFQLYGQAEQHFWYFTAFTMMIVYQDWLCMWPGALLIILQHSLFAYLHNAGLPVHFFPEAYVGFTKLFYHFGIALVHVALCGYWAHLLRLQTLGDAWQRRLLGEDQQLLEEKIVQLEASESALTASSSALEEASRRQRAILDNSADLMWVKDTAGNYTAVNTAFARTVRRDARDIEGTADAAVLGEALAAESAAHEAEAIRLRQPVTRERIMSIDGDARIFEVTVQSIEDEHGVFTGLTGSARDVTDRRRLEEERRRSASQLRAAQKLESLGLLAGGVAHDFNNLLAVIQANAELANADIPADSPARESFDEIERATHRAADLTRQMLAYAGMGRVAIAPVDVSSLVRGTADLLRTAVSKKVTFTLDLEDGLPLVDADATQVRQVVMNLISNASDAIGDAEGVITVRTERTRLRRGDLALGYGQAEPTEGSYVLLEVLDTGTGMDRETRERIFDPFFTTKFVGRGLGLAAVLGILRAHRGAIDITSEVGRGSAFRVYLPASSVQATGVESDTPSAYDVEPVAGSLGRILVVDDEEMLRSLLHRILTRAGYEVQLAVDGVEAIACLDEMPAFRAVVLDMMMPRMNGEETLRAIRARTSDLPVLLSSGFSEAVSAKRLLASGNVAFIQKPYGMRQLLATLASLATGPEVVSLLPLQGDEGEA